jgi:hypothetical protein
MSRVRGRVVFTCLISILWGMSVSALPKPSVVARIPFPFTVEHRQFPAGEYVIQINEGGWLAVRSADGKQSTVALTMPAHGKALDSRGVVVFRQYGDRYFLSQVRVAGSETGRETLQAQDEVELAKKDKAHVVVLTVQPAAGK